MASIDTELGLVEDHVASVVSHGDPYSVSNGGAPGYSDGGPSGYSTADLYKYDTKQYDTGGRPAGSASPAGAAAKDGAGLFSSEGFTDAAMLGSFLFQGIAGLVGSIQQGRADAMRFEFAAQQREFNARMAEFAAKDAEFRGERNVRAIRERYRQLRGAQRASAAAQGVNVDTGTQAMSQVEAQYVAETDVAIARNNAWREAFGLKVSALESRSQAAFDQISASYARSKGAVEGTTLLGSSALRGARFMRRVK